MNLITEAETLTDIPDQQLIRTFKIQSKNKLRTVNDPTPRLKATLKVWNEPLTEYYVKRLKQTNLDNVAHAYLPEKSIRTNAEQHRHSDIIQFDFTGFYDSCRFEYFKNDLKQLDPKLNDTNEHLLKRLLIDPKTGGVTQGLPVSGALAGLSLIPFWQKLRENIPDTIRFTQYSDDLTFSHIGPTPDEFTIPVLSQKIYETLKQTKLDFKLNNKKTRHEKEHFRKITGIRINHENQMTPSRTDYRFLRHTLYILSKSNDLDKELATWGFASKAAFTGKISYMRSIDTTNKINDIIMKYRETCRKHNIFVTWINETQKTSPFA